MFGIGHPPRNVMQFLFWEKNLDFLMLLSTLQIISDRWNLEFRYCQRRSDFFLEESEYTESMGPDEMYPRVLREVPNVVAKPLFMVFENPWHAGEVLGN